eukprot:XP_011674679.1 PREDICTED: leucine-rich repeats and immunoglobulin-like domains protein 2 [Strongylocentrotus purpuratus]
MSTCPTGCQCLGSVRVKVDCSGVEHTMIPEIIPCQTNSFEITNNFLQRIHNGSFPCQGFLEKLKLTNNAIKVIEDGAFDNLVSLAELDLGGNRLATLPPLHFLTMLISVDISHNNFTQWPMQFPLGQTYVSFGFDWNPLNKEMIVPYKVGRMAGKGLQASYMDSCSFHHPEIIRILMMSYGSLETIGSLSQLSFVKFIELSWNRIKLITTDAFQNLMSLVDLQLDNNLISSISAIRRIPIAGSTNIEYIDATSNKITSLDNFRNMHNVYVICVQSNQISVWNESGLTNLTNLSKLKMANNFIQELIYLPSLPSLKYLDLSFNRIRWIQNGAFQYPALEELYLTGNSLTRFPSVTSMVALTYLYLSENRITNISEGDVGEIPSLDILFLNANRLHIFPTLPPNQISTMNLQNNNISNLETQTFENYRSLICLLMDGNNIDDSPPFPSSLERLTLDGNRIEVFRLSIALKSRHYRQSCN